MDSFAETYIYDDPKFVESFSDCYSFYQLSSKKMLNIGKLLCCLHLYSMQ